MAAFDSTLNVNDLPNVILSTIIAAVSDVRSRNCASLVCKDWCQLERSTRSSLTLRGNLRDLYLVPTRFSSISHLDLSLLSPWGHPLTAVSDPAITAHLLRRAFPSLASLTLYARNPSTIHLVAPLWPFLEHVKLVRWHQRPQLTAAGDELRILFSECGRLKSLDLSAFYCWTDDVPPALESYPSIASNLTNLNLLNPSFSEGFKSDEIKIITKACPNLTEFRASCMFDPRYIGYVGDEALISLSVNCPKLRILHLAETSALSNARGDPEDDGYTQEDASINVATLIEVFSGLPLLESLTLDVCNNVRDSGPALEVLNSKCPKLRSLKLGQFHGISVPVESRLDGVALCQRLESLSIRGVGDLTDIGLIAIARGCCRLSKFEIHGCKRISMRGMRTFACLLRRTMVDVRISCCEGLDAVASLKALEPIQDRIERLHIDCIWDSNVEDLDGITYGLDLNQADYGDSSNPPRKKCKYSYDLNSLYPGEEDIHGNGFENGNGFGERTWDRLKCLSLWIPVGQLLTPLTSAGLENCPDLEEIKIKIEGDCRELSKPSKREFGLSTLLNYPQVTKMHLDCGDVIGYAHTAPSGQMDLSLWERFYLYGIGNLNLTELDYWPPQDRDVNQRSLSLPAAGLLQECSRLTKLFIHGTAHEHFMMFLLRIPRLRDVQLREDYYPAPENDMSTEMRADSCSRFEAALNRRLILE
ncbi:F-box/LRR-repeat MAX2 homolog A [Andrographis paniculata]|uniref:F-box/LRR-repeat MAX2 homolog A n=1 Tax=Andrographis paniculata TaxID=175694 RepID=UPI0021E8912D|nr:F-box/LRR-repeat MAX2 homolog A [Andrographis paniculata]